MGQYSSLVQMPAIRAVIETYPKQKFVSILIKACTCRLDEDIKLRAKQFDECLFDQSRFNKLLVILAMFLYLEPATHRAVSYHRRGYQQHKTLIALDV